MFWIRSEQSDRWNIKSFLVLYERDGNLSVCSIVSAKSFYLGRGFYMKLLPHILKSVLLGEGGGSMKQLSEPPSEGREIWWQRDGGGGLQCDF